MRVGDAYKIKAFSAAGSSADEIIEKFRNSYSADEVRRFIPVKKRRTRKDKGVKRKRKTIEE